jgi:PAS domain S-box-containing protein
VPYRSDVRRITQALNWIGVGALVAGIAVVMWALWGTHGVDDFRTAVIVATLGFGVPSVVALAVAWMLDSLVETENAPAAGPAEAAAAAPLQRTHTRQWPLLLQYVAAAGVVVVAAVLRFWMDPILGDRVPFITFFLAVVVAAWIGGFGASAFATALSVLAAWHWFMRGPAGLPPDLLGNAVAGGVFVATALAMGGLTAAMHATAEAADRLSAQTKLRDAELQSVGAELQREHERLIDATEIRTVADAAPVLLWLADASGARTRFNRQWLEFTGLTPDEATGLQWSDAIHPEDRESCLAACDAALRSRAPLRARYRLRRFDGEYRTVIEQALPRFAADGVFAGYVGACMDLDNEPEAAPAALTESREAKRA